MGIRFFNIPLNCAGLFGLNELPTQNLILALSQLINHQSNNCIPIGLQDTLFDRLQP